MPSSSTVNTDTHSSKPSTQESATTISVSYFPLPKNAYTNTTQPRRLLRYGMTRARKSRPLGRPRLRKPLRSQVSFRTYRIARPRAQMTYSLRAQCAGNTRTLQSTGRRLQNLECNKLSLVVPPSDHLILGWPSVATTLQSSHLSSRRTFPASSLACGQMIRSRPNGPSWRKPTLSSATRLERIKHVWARSYKSSALSSALLNRQSTWTCWDG